MKFGTQINDFLNVVLTIFIKWGPGMFIFDMYSECVCSLCSCNFHHQVNSHHWALQHPQYGMNEMWITLRILFLQKFFFCIFPELCQLWESFPRIFLTWVLCLHWDWPMAVFPEDWSLWQWAEWLAMMKNAHKVPYPRYDLNQYFHRIRSCASLTTWLMGQTLPKYRADMMNFKQAPHFDFVP